MNQKKRMQTKVFSILLAVIFGVSSITKFLGVDLMHLPFKEMSLSTWYGYFIAVLEMLMAIGILKKSIASMSAVGMTIILAGMSFYFYSYHSPIYLVPTGLLIIMAAIVAYATHDECITMQDMSEKQ